MSKLFSVFVECGLTGAVRLDAFLELKMENEKLRAELRELQLEYGEEDLRELAASQHECVVTTNAPL